jgi:phage FluMu gp28-like protein
MGSDPGGVLYGYQRRWLEDAARFKIGMFSRQSGKTFTTTLELVLDCLAHEAAGRRTHWVILSRGERQAREAMEHVKRHLQAVQAAFEALETPFDATLNALEVRLPHGARITALPANPDTARGFSANVFLDEFAFHPDSHAIWRALYPVVSAGFRLRVVSTPNGKGNKFYELMTDPALEPIWSRHVVDIYRAVADGLPRDIDELRRGMSDPDGWAQEFELAWVDEASAWLPYDLINAAEHAEAGDPARYGQLPAFLGWDLAARADLSVLWVLEAVGDVLWTRERVELRRAPFRDQLAELDRLFGRYRIVRAALDQTGLGEAPTQDAQRKHGASRVHGVLFTSAAKLDLATRLKEALEDRRLRLPAGDPALRADLHSVQRVAGPSGLPRLVAEREGGSHADRFWALALAVGAASQPRAQYGWTPAPSGAGRWAHDEPTHWRDAAVGRKGLW